MKSILLFNSSYIWTYEELTRLININSQYILIIIALGMELQTYCHFLLCHLNLIRKVQSMNPSGTEPQLFGYFLPFPAKVYTFVSIFLIKLTSLGALSCQ